MSKPIVKMLKWQYNLISSQTLLVCPLTQNECIIWHTSLPGGLSVISVTTLLDWFTLQIRYNFLSFQLPSPVAQVCVTDRSFSPFTDSKKVRAACCQSFFTLVSFKPISKDLYVKIDLLPTTSKSLGALLLNVVQFKTSLIGWSLMRLKSER